MPIVSVNPGGHLFRGRAQCQQRDIGEKLEKCGKGPCDMWSRELECQDEERGREVGQIRRNYSLSE